MHDPISAFPMRRLGWFATESSVESAKGTGEAQGHFLTTCFSEKMTVLKKKIAPAAHKFDKRQ